MRRKAEDCGALACPSCGELSEYEATGKVIRTLFEWQQRRGGPEGKNGPVFDAERDGHDEAEVRCANCGTRFFTIAPVLVADGQGKSSKVKVRRKRPQPQKEAPHAS